MSDEYQKALKRERDREYHRRESDQGMFEASFVHLDFDEAETREKSPKWLSDKGEGVEAIVRAVDGEDGESRYARCIKNARERLRRAHPELVEVFNLVVQNGSNRKESIWTMVSRKRTNGRQQETDTGRI